MRTYTEEEIAKRCLDAGIPQPSSGHDWIDEVLGLIRVMRSQRDDAERRIRLLTNRTVEHFSGLRNDSELWQSAQLFYEKHNTTSVFVALVSLMEKASTLLSERDQLRAELGEARREVERLCRSMARTWAAEHRDFDLSKWGLCDSTAGIISQIDNMHAGMRKERDEAIAELSSLKREKKNNDG